jgi:hypothetical protein
MRDRLTTLVARWKDRINRDFPVGEDSFSDGGDRKGLVFAVLPAKILAFGTGEQTRFRFPR